MYALKLELKLNNKERSYLAGCAGYGRLIYNYGLDLILASWSFEGLKVGDNQRLAAIKKLLTNSVMNRDEYSWMRKYPSTIYQSALNNLGNAFSRYRKGLGKLPVFKAKKDGDSFTVYKSSGVYLTKGQPMISFSNRQVIQAGKKIILPGLPTFRLKEEIPFTCSSQTFTISRSANKWFVSFNIDAQKIPPIIHKTETVGIDLGVKAFATLSNGKTYLTPSPIKKAKTKLRRIQWSSRNKQFGNSKLKIKASNNAKKSCQLLAKKSAQITNQRKDFLQKTTTEISRSAYKIRIEDLNVSGMLANSKLSEAVANQGFYEFRRQLEYKQNFYGTKVEIVDRWYPSSKTCSNCGNIQPIKLSERIFSCQSCSHQIDRDLNASLNLQKAPINKVRLA